MAKKNITENWVCKTVKVFRIFLCAALILFSLTLLLPDKDTIYTFTTQESFESSDVYKYVHSAVSSIEGDDSIVNIETIKYVIMDDVESDYYSIVVKVKYDNTDDTVTRFFETKYVREYNDFFHRYETKLKQSEVAESDYNATKRITLISRILPFLFETDAQEHELDSKCISYVLSKIKG
ncbi:MAG: hypothetical protein IJW48_00955 [Clostridia bacterium]|nr:hypothetical protein [Clostridia bacterium]